MRQKVEGKPERTKETRENETSGPNVNISYLALCSGSRSSPKRKTNQ